MNGFGLGWPIFVCHKVNQGCVSFNTPVINFTVVINDLITDFWVRKEGLSD